jgi:hypothetical protein
VRNIRSRRGSKVDIRVPLFRDRRTPEFAGVPLPSTVGGASASEGAKAAEGYVWQLDGLSLQEESSASGAAGVEAAASSPVTASGKAVGEETKAPEVVMDAMAYGMGCCCLQVLNRCAEKDTDTCTTPDFKKTPHLHE